MTRAHPSTGLYVHVPFCGVKCKFCDFAAFPGRTLDIPRYMAALAKEIRSKPAQPLSTFYVGGGTPTVLSIPDWTTLFLAVSSTFLFSKNHEASVECNPESTTEELLVFLRGHGINRLSFGVQSSQDPLLKLLGRAHNWEGFLKAYRLARRVGFQNINIDLMFGLPTQTMVDWQNTLNDVLALDPEHISAYALTVEDRTHLKHQGVEPDEDLQADMYDWASDRLWASGFQHYEISNYAKPGFECRHNLRYWKNEPCVGVGVAAADYDGKVRRRNTHRLDDYMARWENGKTAVVEETLLTEPERVGENLMLSLRLRDGAQLTPQTRELYGSVIQRFASLGFLELQADQLKPTRQGWKLSNMLFQELLTPPS